MEIGNGAVTPINRWVLYLYKHTRKKSRRETSSSYICHRNLKSHFPTLVSEKGSPTVAAARRSWPDLNNTADPLDDVLPHTPFALVVELRVTLHRCSLVDPLSTGVHC